MLEVSIYATVQVATCTIFSCICTVCMILIYATVQVAKKKRKKLPKPFYFSIYATLRIATPKNETAITLADLFQFTLPCR